MASPKGEIGHIEGMKEAREALQELSKGVQGGVGKRSLIAGAHIFIRSIKSKTQVSTRPGNPTPGSLRDATHIGKVSQRKGGARLEMINDDIASVPNEFGTHKMAAQPFFRPGVDAAREEAAGAVAEGIKFETEKAVAKAAKKGMKG
jgi:HK97 gp10 family phage protein